nr:TIM44-related membrane protein TimA [Brevundimonas aveniformis]
MLDPALIQMIVFAAVAAVLLVLLYNVLGKKVGRQPEDRPAVAAPPGNEVQAETSRPDWGVAMDPAAAEGAAQLRSRDPGFDPARFLDGARQAYETIVRAYAAGDRETLKPLLAGPVMTSFEEGITRRESSGTTEVVELPHPPRADLDHAEVHGDLARARVRFLAEMKSEITHEGVSTTEERRTAELWTFERRIGSGDPNWVLARVEEARA